MITGFGMAWTIADAIPGQLTRDQAETLWDAVMRLPRGTHIVEIGSGEGRSTVILGMAAELVGARVTAVEPFLESGLAGREAFEANIAASELKNVVTLLAEPSIQARPLWTERIDMLYIDGKHNSWTFDDDLRWSTMMPMNSEILVHDCFSSVGVTAGVLLHVLPAKRYSYLGRVGSLARFRLKRPGVADRARLLAEMPWFGRNVTVKVLLRLHKEHLAAKLGHEELNDPY